MVTLRLRASSCDQARGRTIESRVRLLSASLNPTSALVRDLVKLQPTRRVALVTPR